MQSPRLYATFLLWLLSELFETLPEVGDPDKPKLVFFFDEAHLLFDDAPKALVDKVEQVARLIRSKGVGVYFVTQNPAMCPRISWASSATGCSTRCAPSPPRIARSAAGGGELPRQPRLRHRGRDPRGRRGRGRDLDAGTKGSPAWPSAR
jgi:hypothetical protein